MFPPLAEARERRTSFDTEKAINVQLALERGVFGLTEPPSFAITREGLDEECEYFHASRCATYKGSTLLSRSC